jgi:G3E family GTPase
MITRVLAQVIEYLRILHDGAGSPSQIQKFIELSLNESLWNVMRSKSGPKFNPGDDMTSWLHGMVMVPPYAGSVMKLLGCEEGLVLV